MTASPAFERVLKATGYLSASGQPVSGLATEAAVDRPQLRAALDQQRGRLRADAVFSAHEHPISIFKDSGQQEPSEDKIREWHETAWNFGLAPLLWVVAPTTVYLYDCYASSPVPASQSVPTKPLDKFEIGSEERVRNLTSACGRIATETGAFWSSSVGGQIDRRNRVDQQLLSEIAALEQRLDDLTPSGETPDRQKLARMMVQCFIGRCIFTWYLIDRGLAHSGSLPSGLGPTLSDMFATPKQALKLFAWLRTTFNGNLFSSGDPSMEREFLTKEHLRYIRMFVEGSSLISGQEGQGRLFQFQFDAIPINLISSIYEQFARSSTRSQARDQSLHYTPVEVVQFVLDPVFEELPHSATLIDPACGSGVFLVESLRRLVWRATEGSRPTRDLIREILYRQLYGIDVNHSALQVAAFSLYLAALELDDDPISNIDDLKFEPLIDTTLFEADALDAKLPKKIDAKLREQHFDAVVGNPPWKPLAQDADQINSRGTSSKAQMPHQYPDLKFLELANKLTAGAGRVGMVVKSTPVFSLSPQVVKTRNRLIDNHKPCAVINLSHLRNEGLFPKSTAPATLFFSRCKLMPRNDACMVGSVPWSPDFVRTGIFHLDPDAIHTVSAAHVCSKPSSLKSLALGTLRDNWLLDRWEMTFPTLDNVLSHLGINRNHQGRGFNKGKGYTVPPVYFTYPVLDSKTFKPFRLQIRHLRRFGLSTLRHPIRPSIFKGPLILCPGSIKLSLWEGTVRYVVSTCDDDVLYDSNFFGISCANLAPEIARVLAAILSSSITTYQLMLKASCLGVEGTSLRFQDLCSLRVPPLHAMAEDGLRQFDDLIEVEQHLATNANDRACHRALDEEVYKLYNVRGEEQTLIEDNMDRVRQCLGGRELRMQAVQPPRFDTLCVYGRQVTETINAYLRVLGRRHLESTVYARTLAEGEVSSAIHGLAVVRFAMLAGPPSPSGVVRKGVASGLERVSRILSDEIGSGNLPYLHEQRNLRLYNGDEVFIVKPNETRYWSRTSALNDADAILGDHWGGDKPNHTPECNFPGDWQGFNASGFVLASPVADPQSGCRSHPEPSGSPCGPGRYIPLPSLLPSGLFHA